MSVLLLVSVVELIRYYIMRSDPSQEALTRRSFRLGGSAALLFSVILFLSPLLREVFETLFNLSILGWLFILIIYPLLFVMAICFFVYFLIRDNPEKVKLSDRLYTIGCLAGFTLILLAFLRAIIG